MHRILHRRRAQGRRACLAGATLVAAIVALGAVDAIAQDYPRARLAADAQQVASTMDAALGGAPAAVAANALAGSWGEQTLLVLLANLSSAMNAPALADRQWALATALAERREDHAGLIDLLGSNAQTALALGDYSRCSALAGRLLALASERHDRIGEAIAENALGVVARRRGDLDQALLRQQRALSLRSASGGAGIGPVLGDLGTIYRDRGDFALALEAQLDAIVQRERIDEQPEIAYRNVALLYREIEDLPAARDYFQRALDGASRRGVPSVYASVVGSHASFLNDAGEFAQARAAAQEALAIDTALGDLPHQGLEHLEIGRALLGSRDIDAASDHLAQALALGRRIGQNEIVARALLHLTEVALARQEPLRARGLIDEAVATLETSRLRPQLAQAYALREQLARAEHNDADALRFAHKYSSEREQLIGVRASRRLAALEAAHARADAEQRLELLAKDNELQAARIESQRLQWRLYAAAVVGLLIGMVALVWRHLGVRRLNRALGSRNREVERQRVALSEANARLEAQAVDLNHAATTDWLTKVDNRRHLLAQLDQLVDDCHRNGRELALMVIDFDHFKQINDLGGHPFGDRVLVAGAKSMRDCLGPNDLLGRFGGEEFVAVACDRDAAAAVALAERIRVRVAEHLASSMPELRGVATISIGVARLAELDAPPRSGDLLEAADRALYAAKSEGRNRVARYAA